MRISGSVLGVLLAASLAGACANSSKQQQAKTTAPTSSSVANCPLAEVPGVRAVVQDIPGGVQIVVAGPEGQVDRIRENVRAMATTNNNQGDPFAPCACALKTEGAAEPMASGGGMTELQAARLIPLSNALVEQTPTGGLLKLTAKDPNQATALRQRTRQEVTALKNCLHGAEMGTGQQGQGH
jgi:hypothetical protein